jgi:hypothetical protein
VAEDGDLVIQRKGLRLAVAAIAAAVACAVTSPAAVGDARFKRLDGFPAPGTPDELNRVGVLKMGAKDAPNVLVLNPGTSASAAYFAPLARTIVRDTGGNWQVWSVERRENLLEDQSMLNKVKDGRASAQRFFDYYLGWLADPDVHRHLQPVPDADVPFARDWGMNVELHDLRRVVKAAGNGGRTVVLGGHSLGGSITTAYATWDFNGQPGGDGLSGLVFIDGGSGPTPITRHEAKQALEDLQSSSPWLAFGGIPSPYLGLFSAVGSTLTKIDPDGPSLFEGFPLLPSNIVPPVPVTNEAGFGYAIDTGTSPENLIAAQVHAGHLAASGDPRGWVRDGDITPIQRWASALSGTGLRNLDGTAWYHPMRLTIDSRAVADGNANPAQRVLDVRAIHGDDLTMPIYAFGAALGGQRVLDAAEALAQQSNIPSSDVTLVDRHRAYAHNDPAAADPGDNAFIKHLIPFLERAGTG